MFHLVFHAAGSAAIMNRFGNIHSLPLILGAGGAGGPGVELSSPGILTGQRGLQKPDPHDGALRGAASGQQKRNGEVSEGSPI